MLIKTNAIVLRTVAYGDDRLLAHLFSEVRGRVVVAVKLSSSQKGRMQRRLFQPLSLLTVEIDFRENRDVQRLKNVAMHYAWTSVYADAAKISVTLFLAEVLFHTLRQETEDVRTYGFVELSLKCLDMMESNRGKANFHLAFLVGLTRCLGFFPADAVDSRGDVFDMRTGQCAMSMPPHRDVLRGEETEAMRRLLRMDYGNLHRFAFTREERRRCLDMVLAYYRIHVSSFPELRTIGVLEELFG